MLSGKRFFLLLAALLAALCFHIATLSRYPTVFVDEVWLISRAWAWLQTGMNFGPLDAGVYDKRLEGYETFFPIIPTLLVSIFVRYFGLAVDYLRILPLLLGIGLLAAVYSIAYQLSDSRRCGLIAALLVSMSISFVISAHMIRYDIIVAALSYGAIALAIASCRRRSALLGLLSGLMLSAAFEAHMNAAIYGPLLLAVFVAYERWEIIRSRPFGAFVGGALIGLAAYIWLHLRYPDTYFAMGAGMAATHRPPLLSNLIDSVNSLLESGAYLFEFTTGRIIAVVIVSWLAYRTKMVKVKIPGYLLLIGLMTFLLVIKNKVFYYAILVSPLIDIFLAVWIEEMLRSRVELDFWQTRIKALAISTLVVTLVAPVYFAFANPKAGDLQLVATRVKRLVPAGATIMGPPTFWFGLNEYRYLGWMQYIVHKTFDSKISLESALRELHPEFLIVDSDLRQFILPDQDDPPRSGIRRYRWERRIPKREIDSLLAERGKLVDSFDTLEYGEVELFSINWDGPKQ